MKQVKIAIIGAVLTVLSACDVDPRIEMDVISESYVKLSLEIGEYEPGYIDAYYGPEDWAIDAADDPRSLRGLKIDAGVMLDMLAGINPQELGIVEQLRLNFLTKQLIAAHTRIRMIEGETFTFDEETALLYDAVSPAGDVAEWEATLVELSALLPGEGDFKDRFMDFRKQFIIPTDKLAAVFDAAIDGCRAQTRAHIDMPANESFSFEFVTDKAWSGYNWYQGGAHSFIQVNTDFPIYIERAVDLGCHEGYPGHHAYNAMLEKELVKKRGWREFTVYPLYSPQSLVAEGTANYGIEMAFPGDMRLQFETEVLYPLAGISTENAGLYTKMRKLISNMRYNYTDVARSYLDGHITRDEAIAARARYGLMSMEKAEQSIRFMEQYRGYVINYTLGMDLSADFVTLGSQGSALSRWDVYSIILSTPMTASELE